MNIKKFIEKQNWIFAKTYAKTAPHEYILRQKVVGTEKDYEDAVKYILENGFRGFYFKSPRIYLIVDNMAYWAMTEKVEESTVLNRCKLSDYDIVMYPKKEY